MQRPQKYVPSRNAVALAGCSRAGLLGDDHPPFRDSLADGLLVVEQHAADGNDGHPAARLRRLLDGGTRGARRGLRPVSSR